jgi:hypothetical protein
VPNNLAGHFRFAGIGALAPIEFALGWNDAILSRVSVSAAATRAAAPSRAWLHASAVTALTGERVPKISLCTCGARRPVSGLGPGRGGGITRRVDH